MNLVTKTRTSDGRKKVEVDLKELVLRLQSLTEGCNIEIVQLAISSMLDEIKEALGSES